MLPKKTAIKECIYSNKRMNKITVEDIRKKKGKGKITVLTCYDYSFAKALDGAGLDIILVGDSLANVVLGLEDIKQISINEMINHTKAVSLATTRSLIVADMPYASYQKNPKKCLYYAEKFIQAGADAVKIEWFESCPQVISRLIKNRIPVMGHIGLTPQTAHLLGDSGCRAKISLRQKQFYARRKLFVRSVSSRWFWNACLISFRVTSRKRLMFQP